MRKQFQYIVEANQRYVEIDSAKGVAIILVVLGHLSQGIVPDDHGWFLVFKRCIYSFHMPLFMFLSGFVYELVARKRLQDYGFSKYMFVAFRRLFPAWLLVGTFIIGLKIFIGKSVEVNNQVEAGFGAFLEILYDPMNSGARSLWYVHTLLILYLIFAFAGFYIPSWKKPLIFCAVIATVLGALLELSSIMGIKQVFFYAGFFAIGGLAFRYWERFHVVSKKYLWLWLLLFIACLIYNIDTLYVRKAVCGLFSIPVIVGIVALLKGRAVKILTIVGQYTFTIYLFNTLVIGVMILIFHKFSLFGGWGFWLYLSVTTIFSTWGIILVHQFLHRFSPAMAKYFK